MIESRTDYKDTPGGQYKYWEAELTAAEKRLKKWKKAGDKVVNRYIDKRSDLMSGRAMSDTNGFRLNMFHSNIQTMTSIFYGNLPVVDVSRKYADANDDVSRVAAETMERLLNSDIENNGEEYNAVLAGVLQDRLLPGLGCARVRYEVEAEGEIIINERAPVDYYHWRDVLWSWGRNFSELTWIAYRNYLTKDEVEEKYGKAAAEGVTLKKQMTTNKESEEDPELDSAWMKAEVWEIWDKSARKCVWVSLGYDKTLASMDDPLKLKGFFPSPPFFMANATTSLYIPVSDYHMSQDLYNEIDLLQTRISILTEAVKAVGVYDKSAEGIQRMFKEGVDNDLIPVDNWALFADKGGLKGQIDWVPIADIVGALDKLRQLRDETIALLQQVTGMSDIMQGALQNQYEGVGQSQIKAKFGSVRIQKMQETFAKFASDLMQIKAEVIAIHFEPETIAKQSNMQLSFDAPLLPQAIALIKQPAVARLKIAIKAESIAMTDFAQLQNERTSFLNGLSTFMQSAAPLIDADPSAKPFLLQLLQWGLAGFKGSSEIEGVIDKAIEASEQQQEEDKPDPEMQKLQLQREIQDKNIQGDLQKIQAKGQADLALRNTDLQADMQTNTHASQNKQMEIRSNMEANLAEISAKASADIQVEIIQSEANAEQKDRETQSEIIKDAIASQDDLKKLSLSHAAKMKEIAATAQAKKVPTEKPDQ